MSKLRKLRSELKGLWPTIRSGSRSGPALQPMARSLSSQMNQWLLCFVVCNFNVDIGPEIELIYPPDVSFSEADAGAICFSSFPERHDSEIAEDMYFNFNLQNTSPDIVLSSPSPPYGSTDVLYGTSVFRQEHDVTTKRNYNQKSLVIVSNHDFPVFFMALLRMVTEESTMGDVARLEASCAQIAAWQSPHVGKQDLPFLGRLISLDIPLHSSFPLTGGLAITGPSVSVEHGMSASEPTTAWSSLLPLLPNSRVLYVLYERLILRESVIVVGQTPGEVSAVCTALLDLIRPVPYTGIVRPYIPLQSTAHEGNSGLFGSQEQHKFIAGVTNPFLLQQYSNMDSSSVPYILALAASGSKVRRSSTTATQDFKLSHLNPTRSLRNRRSSGTEKIDLPGTPLRSQSQPEQYIKVEKSFINTLDVTGAEDSRVASLNVRRHFADLTARLLAPVNRYMATVTLSNPTSEKPLPLMPSDSDTSNATAHSFDVDSFLAYLHKQDSSNVFVGQTSHGRYKSQDAFYRKFCTSKNFTQWLQDKITIERGLDAGLYD